MQLLKTRNAKIKCLLIRAIRSSIVSAQRIILNEEFFVRVVNDAFRDPLLQNFKVRLASILCDLHAKVQRLYISGVRYGLVVQNTQNGATNRVTLRR